MYETAAYMGEPAEMICELLLLNTMMRIHYSSYSLRFTIQHNLKV